MKNKFILIILLLSLIINETKNDYLWPTNTSNTITTLFGEKRSRRFHAGIDVRTFGKIGDKIFAVESGYISRIKISSDGYGKALYLKLNDGNTVLYAHLDRYSDSIESIVNNIQKLNNNSFIDQYFEKNKYKVNKGDVVGYCGDTGSLSGPHLHFEIRDPNGKPINPLKTYYSLEDTLKPIANSIAFIPLNKNCYINGKQDYEVVNLEPLKYNDVSTIYKYFIHDTISVIGNFGIALNTYDKMNNSPFKFGIYEIEMLIDNKEVYKLNFDNYHFAHDPLIYKEIDFNLLSKTSENFHRLFINHNQDLNFIDNNSNYGLALDKKFHNLIINISDNANNQIQVQGIIKGDIITTPEATYSIENNTLIFKTPPKNINFMLSTRYEKSREIPITYTLFDSIIYKFENTVKPYEVLKYYINKNGIKSHPSYISIHKYDPMKITGKFQIEHFDNNVSIKFIENEFSGHQANLIIEYKNSNKKTFNMYRLDKNILSSNLFDLDTFLNIDKIHIEYISKPEIIFTENINGNVLYHNKNNYFKYKNYNLYANDQSLYNDIFIWSKNDNVSIPNSYEIIENPISIYPNNIPFKGKVQLSYFNDKSGAIYQYTNNKWKYIQKSNNDSLSTDITTGGTFAILNEKNKPIINNIFPNFKSVYTVEDIQSISFNTLDYESSINYNKIKIQLNDELLFYDYIPYRNHVIGKINGQLKKGNNHLSIITEDNLGNSKKIQGSFTIK